MSGPKRRLAVTPAQALYLVELISDDLADTDDLTVSERQQARALLRKLREMTSDWETGFDPTSTGQAVDR